MLDGLEVTATTDPGQQDYFWISLRRTPREDLPDSEGEAIRAGRISVTPLRFERTDEVTFQDLRHRF